MRATAILWDLDGTLADTSGAHERAFRAVLDAEGVSGFTYDAYRGLRTPDVFARLGFPGERIDGLVADKRARALEELAHAKPLPGALDVVARFRDAGVRQGVVTSASRAGAERTMAATGLAPDLELWVTAETHVTPKPSAAPFLLAAREHGLDVTSTLVVEDAALAARGLAGAGFHRVFLLEPDAPVREEDGCVVVPHLADVWRYAERDP